MIANPKELFDISGKTAVVTGASGALGSAVCRALAAAGVKVGVMSRTESRCSGLVGELRASGGQAMPLTGDVLAKDQVCRACDAVLAEWGRVDFLLNFAGGNNAKATAMPGTSFFDLPAPALQSCFDLNLTGTIIPSQVFGQAMAQQKEGVILNVSSMTAERPLTRIVAYSAAKAAINNFTQWLAVHMAQNYSPLIRVNAIAPGFFLTEQNRFLLTDKNTGARTERGESIIKHTPMSRYGEPEDLIGAIWWLLSPGASFVTGVVVPIDGGFSAFSGV